jgi:hypothetical protein
MIVRYHITFPFLPERHLELGVPCLISGGLCEVALQRSWGLGTDNAKAIAVDGA